MRTVYHQIRDETKDKNFILFTESREPVPHLEILGAIQKADFGIIAYPPNSSTENTIPTKLFEYLGYGLPILLIDHAPWVERCRPFSAAIPFHPDNLDAGGILYAMEHHKFYSEAPNDVFWESEEVQLLQTIATLLINSSK